MTGPRSNRSAAFDPSELGTTDPADLADALESARRLEASIDEAPITTGARFTDRVMAALASEPAPASTGFLSPLRRRGLIGGFGASVRQAWASIGAPGRPTFARAAALAYVLAIAIAGTSLAGAATITVAGALGIIGPHESQPTPSLPAAIMSPEPSARPNIESESPGPDASESPDASDDHGGNGGPEPSNDHGGNSGAGSGGDEGSGDGGGGDHATGSPTGGDGGDDGGDSGTPRPTQTPRPSETPKATSGSGGSNGGGASG